MTPHEYRKLRPGDRVRTRRPLRNGWAIIPAGSVGTVTYKRSGAHVDFDPCPCCRVAVRMSKIPPSDLDVTR